PPHKDIDTFSVCGSRSSEGGSPFYKNNSGRRILSMANLQERRDKDGKLISYSSRIYGGRRQAGKQLKPCTATVEVERTCSETSARKKAEAYAATLEDQCKKGLIQDTRQTFASYCDYVIALKEQRGAKHSTVYRYNALAVRIDEKIGHIKLTDL